MRWLAIKANLNSSDDGNDDDYDVDFPQEIEILKADAYKNRD